MIIFSILVFFLLFSLLIIVHEWGHFFAARKSGVKVEEFGLGMGKKLYGKKVGEVEYTLNAVPFGGFVRMLGEEEDSKDPRSFNNAKLWKRMIITLAGVFMNFVMGIVILSYLFTVGTNPIILTQEGFDQAVAEGVIILDEPDEEGKEAILEIKKVQVDFPASIVFATKETYRISGEVLSKVASLPLKIYKDKKIPEDIAGPLGIAEATHKILPQGVNALLKLLALLSLSLGVMNLLPIPALDGGRFFFQIIELISFRKPSAKWENAIHVAGFLVLMTLMVLVTWNDIVRMFIN